MGDTIAQLHSTESEALHRTMYRLHDAVYKKALGSIGEGLAVLHKLEGSRDVRVMCRRYIADMEGLRDRLEKVVNDAAEIRSKFIRENGCDGSCTK